MVHLCRYAFLLSSIVSLSAIPAPESDAQTSPNDWGIALEGIARLKVDTFDNPLFGLSPSEDFTSLQYRATAKILARHSNGVSAVVDVGYYDQTGRSPGPRLIDKNNGDLLQAFISFEFASNEWDWELRVGRQHNPQGASRISARREAPNAIRSFDGASLSLEKENLRLSAFALRPTERAFGAFDDRTDFSEAFWGTYLSGISVASGADADLYYFGRRDENITWAQGSGDETRHSVGGRLYSEGSKWRGNVEAIYQFGHFNSEPISAWALGWELSRNFRQDNSLELGVRGNVVSGDKDPDDPKLQTFSAIYPRFSYYSPAATFAPTNSWDLQGFAKFSLENSTSLSFSAGAIERLERGDDVYAVPYIPLGFLNEQDDHGIATITTIEYQLPLKKNATLKTSITHINAEELISSRTNVDITHFTLSLSNRF